MALAAFSNHHALTLTAEQLCCQQIVLFCFCHCGSMAVLLNAFLHTVEQVFRNDSRNAALNYNILIAILANVFAVFQQRAETIDIERLSLFRSESTDIEIFHNRTNRFPSAYFSNTSTTNGAVVGSTKSFCAFLSNR